MDGYRLALHLVAGTLLSAKGICYHIGLAGMVADFSLIITEQFYPSPLSHVQVFLVKDVLQALVVSEDCALGSIEIMSPNLQCKDYCS